MAWKIRQRNFRTSVVLVCMAPSSTILNRRTRLESCCLRLNGRGATTNGSFSNAIGSSTTNLAYKGRWIQALDIQAAEDACEQAEIAKLPEFRRPQNYQIEGVGSWLAFRYAAQVDKTNCNQSIGSSHDGKIMTFARLPNERYRQYSRI